MAQVQCRVEIPKPQDEEAANLTVGQIFQLVCEGEWPVLKPEALELRLEKEDIYKLKLLKFEYTSKTEGTLTVTSYRPGPHQLKAVQLVDSENSVVLGDLNFTVASVINPQEPPAEPYGAIGPLKLMLPIWYPLTAALILVAVFVGVFYRWKVRRDKRKLLEEMHLAESVQEPYFQFYQVLRKLQRTYSYFSGAEPSPQETQKFIDDLGAAYKIYLARHFQVPTLKWKERQILTDLKRNHKKFYQNFRLEVRKAFAEIARAQQAREQITGQDARQLLDLLRNQVDQIETWLKGKPS